MTIDRAEIVYVLIFLAVLLVVEGGYLLFRDLRRGAERGGRRRRRLRLSRPDRSNEALSLRHRVDRRPAWAVGPLGRLYGRISGSDLAMSTGRLALAVAGLVAAVSVGLILAGVAPLYALPLATTFGVGLAILHRARRRRLRLRRLGQQLPDAIDLMVRSLRAGHPITAAVGLVAKEMPDPIGTAFATVVDETTYGLELAEALERMRTRFDHPDLHFMVASITLQHATGGNLAEMLSNLAGVIRDRVRLHQKIAALSAEGRMSALVLGVLPFGTALIMHLHNPDYYLEAARHPVFPVIFSAAAMLYAGAMYAIYRIIRIRV
jgi:tight adherence protein B